MKKLLSTLLLFLCIQLHAQPFTLKYIYQYSTATVPPTNYFVLLDPGNGQYQKSSIQALGTVIGNFLSITNGGGSFSNVTVITIIATTNINNYSFSTNIVNNTLITTNVTIEFPGGVTNLNLTPKTLMWADVNDAEASIPNASGFLAQSGSGDIGWSNTLSLADLDAQNAYLTNTFLLITDKFIYPDSNGQITGLANASGVLQNNGSGVFTWVAAPAPGGSAGGVLSGTYPNPGFANPDTFPGPVTVPSLTNTGNMLMKGTETNSTMGTGLVHSDSLGGRSSSAVVAGDISGALTQNTSGTATFVTQPAIGTFGSDSNSITMSTNINNVFFFVANKAVSLTNVTLSIAGQMTYADLIVSNSLATSITNYQTIPGAKIFGVNSAGTATNALIIPAGKEGYTHIECRGINETNVFNCVQQ